VLAIAVPAPIPILLVVGLQVPLKDLPLKIVGALI